MLKCNLEILFSLGLVGWLIAFFFLWLKEEISLSRLKPFSHIRIYIYRCPVCTCQYFLSPDAEYSCCPFCNSINKTQLQDNEVE